MASKVELGTIINDGLSTNDSEWGKAIVKFGGQMEQIERDMAAAFSGDESKLKTVAKRHGMTGEVNVEALQLKLKMAYEKAQRCFTMITQLIDSAHNTMMRVINQIGGR